jgi:glyoxylase-like metal-dependent hydrolase (beta-lactamase superfamily II)
MWFEQIVRKETGCATYVIGSLDTGECAVYDPLWDIRPYQEAAAEHSSKVRYVIDSHSHADHVSGGRRLAKITGAELILPALADITYEATRVEGGDKIRMGEVTMEMVHAPGHLPEQLCLLITDHSRSDQPWCILTADFLLVGDVARPDLGQPGVEGAEIMFDKALPLLHDLPDFVEVYPGHVAGST